MTATKNNLISMEQIGKKGAMNVQYRKFGQNDLESSSLNQTPNGRLASQEATGCFEKSVTEANGRNCNCGKDRSVSELR
jgi:hypothetical protein